MPFSPAMGHRYYRHFPAILAFPSRLITVLEKATSFNLLRFGDFLPAGEEEVIFEAGTFPLAPFNTGEDDWPSEQLEGTVSYKKRRCAYSFHFKQRTQKPFSCF